MSGYIGETGATYSRAVGLVYVFNLVVGTGALTMPKAFSSAGWLLSLITILVLSLMGFMTVTFVVESMAIANALTKKQIRSSAAVNDDAEYREQENNEREPLLLNAALDSVDEQDVNPYEITKQMELGQMARMFFNRVGTVFFNMCIVIYLYGDLAIYAAAVPKSLRDIACTYKIPHNNSGNSTKTCSMTLSDDDNCWESSTISRMSMYRVFVAAFFLVLGGFTFFNVQKTKYLQLATTLFRWIAFTMMIVLTVIQLDKKQGHGNPSAAKLSGVPNLFGVCVYSFMCHHSIPSMITPIKNKSKLTLLLGCDYFFILVFYIILSFTGIYTFSNLNDLYTLNFLPDSCNESLSVTQVKFIQYFLALFPVFTLSSNFPIISITLRNNLKTIGYREDRQYPWIMDRIAFPILTLIPPLAIALGTNQVAFLVGITGSYAGAGIQYVIPAMLVFCARKQMHNVSDSNNIHSSPFKGQLWIIFVCVWAVLCVIFVTVNHIVSGE